MRVQKVDPESCNRTGIGRRCAIIALSMACAAFAHRITVDVMQWRQTPTAHARDVLGDPNATEQQRIDAMVIVAADARLTIDLLRQHADGRGSIGDAARAALAGLRR